MINPMNMIGTKVGGDSEPQPSSTIGLWHFDNNLTAAVGNDFSDGGPGTTYPIGVFSAGASIDTWGQSNLTVALDPNVVPVTLEFWAKMRVAYRSLMAAYTEHDLGGVLALSITSAAFGSLQFNVYNTSGQNVGYAGKSSIPMTTWKHFATVISATTIDHYYDGGRVASIAKPANLRSIKNLRTDSLEGPYIDELRISAEARYSGSTYTVPTAPFT